MKRVDLIDAIGGIDGKYVMEAEYQGKVKQHKVLSFGSYQTWISLAACLCVLVLAGYVGGNHLLNRNKHMEGIEKVSEITATGDASEEVSQESAVEESAWEEDALAESAVVESTEADIDAVDEGGDAFGEEAQSGDGASTEEMQAGNNPILEEPPVLTIKYAGDGTQLSIRSGSSEWNRRVEGDEWIGVVADAAMPLEQKYDETNTIYLMDNIQSDKNSVELQFEVMPDRLEVTDCWKEGSKVNENMAAIESGKANILVPFTDGSYIYEIVAYWDSTDYRGTAYYCIRTVSNN